MINRKQKIPYIIAISIAASGCESIGPEVHAKLPLDPVTQEQEKTEVVYQELSNENYDETYAENSKVQLYPGTGQFISQRATTKSPKSSGKGEYSLNFDEADLGEVAKVILGDILGENYVLSPKVAGKVTLQTSKPLSQSELLPTLDMVLGINNAAMVYQEGTYQIKPKADAVQGSAFGAYNKYKKQMPRGYQVKVVPVKNVAVEELAEIIKPLMAAKSILHVDSNRNMMLLAGTGAELERAMGMVNTFDVDVMKGRSFGLFPLQHVDAAKIIEELEQVFQQKSSASGKGFFQFMAIERLNSILAITQQSKYLKDIERWVFRLDKANTSAGGGVIVYKVQHVNAVDLAATLNDIFSESGNKDRPASVAAGRKTVKVTNKEKKTAKVTKTSTLAATSLSDVGEVKIIADEINNALIIVATAQDYTVVQRVIKDLDVMPLQVLIDATIVDVSLSDSLKYGIKWALTHSNDRHASSSNGGLFDTAAKIAAATATGGFSYAFVGGDMMAVLEAEAGKGNVNIVSSPSLMVLNNQEANIQVGDEISLKTSDVANTNSDGTVTTTFEQRKTGVTVNVKPRVNANGLVVMDIEQSIENFGNTSSGTSGNPDILSREIKSSVAVQSGETIVLGGLISERTEFKKSGIPYLHEIPYLGVLFGVTEKVKKKTELVVLITPRVVKSRQDARLVTNEFKRKLSGIYEEPVKVNNNGL